MYFDTSQESYVYYALRLSYRIPLDLFVDLFKTSSHRQIHSLDSYIVQHNFIDESMLV